MADEPKEITILLRRWTAGDRAAGEDLFAIMMPDIWKIARRCLAKERPNHTLQTGDLIGILYEKLAEGKKIEFADRNHFYAICTIQLRRILIEHARKYHKVQFVAMDGLPERLFGYPNKLDLVLAVNKLLDELEEHSIRRCCVVVLKSYLDCSDKEVARVLGISQDIVQHEFHHARKWLFQRLGEDPPCQAIGTAPSR
ncbi:MAG TPA: ECF-type sigma factor [Candidatus Angelobacter sp.]|nr:ECF-type sigma factor [Candidatus Angelobacter sp.]